MFENTVLAIENSGEVLKRAQLVFFNLTGSNTNPTLQKLEEEYAPQFAAQSDKIYLNENLYQRIKAIDISKLKGEEKRLTEYYLQNFEIAGANLSASDKEKVKKINEEVGYKDKPLAIFWNIQEKKEGNVNITSCGEYVIIPKEFFYQLIKQID